MSNMNNNIAALSERLRVFSYTWRKNNKVCFLMIDLYTHNGKWPDKVLYIKCQQDARFHGSAIKPKSAFSKENSIIL